MISWRLLMPGMLMILAGCAQTPKLTMKMDQPQLKPMKLGHPHYAYAHYVRPASVKYGIDEKLIRSIIEVESSFNPTAISKSNAIGLMQIKSQTSGRDVFRLKGRNGQPSRRELMDPAQNIDIGTAYLSILKNQHLVGIKNPKTMHYAMIVSYANGAGALLRIFSKDKKIAIQKINSLTPEAFYQHVKKKHPTTQAPRYLYKVDTVYTAAR